jgi:hypothetical protein
MAVAYPKLDSYVRQVEIGVPFARRRRGRRRALLDFASNHGVQTQRGPAIAAAQNAAAGAVTEAENAYAKAIEALAIAQGVSPPDLADIYAQLAAKAATDLTNVVAGSVTATLIATGAVGAGALANGSIVAAKLADNAVELAKLADGAVSSTKILAGAVTTNKINAGAITANEIATGAVTADKILAGAIVAGKIGADAVGANNIAANAINANHIGAGAVTAGKINVASLSAIQADMGLITAGRIVLDNGQVVRAIGTGFGTGSQFVEWFGMRAGILTGSPPAVSLSLCSEANAIQYLRADGDAYFRGTMLVGTMSTSAQTSDSSATAYVEMGPFGSNGGIITINYSFVASGGHTYYPASGVDTTYAANYTLTLERSINAGAYATVATPTVAGSQTKTVDVDPETGGYWLIETAASVSGTFTDMAQVAQDRKYRLAITSRSLGFGTYPGYAQRLSILSQE